MNVKKVTALCMAALLSAGLMACAGSKKEENAADGKKTLKVAMECGYAPYNWTQPDNSNNALPISGSQDFAYGYDVMMAKKIADELGYELEIVKLDWDSLVPAVQSGSVDCVIAGQSITSERMQSVDFSKPYYYASVVSLVKKDGKFAQAKSIEDLAGAKITSQQNTIWYDLCAPQIKDAQILPAQESSPAALVALNSDKCDLVITDMPTAMAAVVAYPDFLLLDFSGGEGDYQVSEEEVNIGISMKKGNTELKTAIDSVLEKMSEDDFKKMMNDAIAVQPLSN
ncbi:MAG: transporter substrate-binding domain-containing protein [Johnsonella sp.]|nr:transporter substrate-binding domain-containing protein [Johnsonella sp.]